MGRAYFDNWCNSNSCRLFGPTVCFTGLSQHVFEQFDSLWWHSHYFGSQNKTLLLILCSITGSHFRPWPKSWKDGEDNTLEPEGPTNCCHYLLSICCPCSLLQYTESQSPCTYNICKIKPVLMSFPVTLPLFCPLYYLPKKKKKKGLF